MQMWTSFSPTTKFSIIAFVITAALGLLSMGALGYGLYYLVKPLLGNRIDEIHGDASWPSIILAGMAWSVGFIIAGLIHHYLKRFNFGSFVNITLYIVVLWGWILIVWWWIIEFKVIK